MKHFYGHTIPQDQIDKRVTGENLATFEQWITMETPGALAVGENPEDRAYALHRSLYALNLFLQTVLIATSDVRIRRVSTRDFRPSLIIGAVTPDRKWHFLSDLMMHPEAVPESLALNKAPINQQQLTEAISAIITGMPYLNTALWRSRAQRAIRQTGDSNDAIISYQIAAESLLFDTYRMTLIDEGQTSAEIDEILSSEIRFRSLLVNKMPNILGGSWDTSRADTPVGFYWQNLYLMRNRIVHAGYQTHESEAETAQQAYRGLRDHLEEQLWRTHNRYPRTLLSRFGTNQLEDRGWLSNSVRAFLSQLESEPGPYYWPVDQRLAPPSEVTTWTSNTTKAASPMDISEQHSEEDEDPIALGPDEATVLQLPDDVEESEL